jgi:hypothetical protein
MRPAEVVLAPGPKNAGGPGLRAGPGLSLGSFARAGDLGPNEDDQLAGTWQVAFLGEIEPRAARPGIAAPASETSRPSHSPGCQIAHGLR